MAFAELIAHREGSVVVSAQVEGTEISASADVDVVAAKPGQLPDDFIPGILLTAPFDGATVVQNDAANGCEFEENRGYGFQVEFSWNEIEIQPGFIGYELNFWMSDASLPVLQEIMHENRYKLVRCNSFVTDDSLAEGVWWVEARFDGPLDRTIQSERRRLNFSSCRHDDGSACATGL